MVVKRGIVKRIKTGTILSSPAKYAQACRRSLVILSPYFLHSISLSTATKQANQNVPI